MTHNTREWEQTFRSKWEGANTHNNSICTPVMNEMVEDIHQELQKARQDWLREEIVLLKRMVDTSELLHHNDLRRLENILDVTKRNKRHDMNTTPERSVEEITSELEKSLEAKFNLVVKALIQNINGTISEGERIDICNKLNQDGINEIRQTLQAERQRCEEAVIEERERIISVTKNSKDAFMSPLTERRWLQAIQSELEQPNK